MSKVHWILPLQFLLLCVLSQCSAREFDFFLFSRQWPATFCDRAKCTHQPANKTVFTIHGLWPEYADHSWPQDCDPSNKFDVAQVQDLMDEMNTDWPSFLLASFWAHEWEKHGTCSLSVFPTEHEYFAATLHLHEKYDLEDALAAEGIVPSATVKYALRDILAAFKKGLGTAPQLVCSAGELNEVRMCVTKELEPFDCTMMHRECPWEVKLPPFPVMGGAVQQPQAAAATAEPQAAGPADTAAADGEESEQGSDAEGGMMGGGGEGMRHGGHHEAHHGEHGEHRGKHHRHEAGHGEGGEPKAHPQGDGQDRDDDEEHGPMHRPHHDDDDEDDDDNEGHGRKHRHHHHHDDEDEHDDHDDDDDGDDEGEDQGPMHRRHRHDEDEDDDGAADDDDVSEGVGEGRNPGQVWEQAPRDDERPRLLAAGPRGHPAAEWFHHALWGEDRGHASPAAVAAVCLAVLLTVGFVVALVSPRARAAAMGGVGQGVACAYAQVASKDLDTGCGGAGAGGVVCAAAVAAEAKPKLEV